MHTRSGVGVGVPLCGASRVPWSSLLFCFECSFPICVCPSLMCGTVPKGSWPWHGGHLLSRCRVLPVVVSMANIAENRVDICGDQAGTARQSLGRDQQLRRASRALEGGREQGVSMSDGGGEAWAKLVEEMVGLVFFCWPGIYLLDGGSRTGSVVGRHGPVLAASRRFEKAVK